MARVKIKDIIKAKAIADDYEFAYGPRPFLNYELTLKDLKDGVITLLMLPQVERGLYLTERPFPSTTEFSLFLQFARKWEAGNTTKSKLDETYDQKYELRIEDLEGEALDFIRELACANNFRMISHSMQAEINLYASNVDAVNCEFVLRTV